MYKSDYGILNEASASEEFVKFGYIYRTFILKEKDYFAEFPMFESLDKLNNVILELVNIFKKNRGTLRIKFVYAEARFISLVVNESTAINFDVQFSRILPPKLVLILRGLKMSDIKKSIKRSGIKLKVSLYTLRFAQGGIKIDGVSNEDERCVTLRLLSKKRNKISQIT